MRNVSRSTWTWSWGNFFPLAANTYWRASPKFFPNVTIFLRKKSRRRYGRLDHDEWELPPGLVELICWRECIALGLFQLSGSFYDDTRGSAMLTLAQEPMEASDSQCSRDFTSSLEITSPSFSFLPQCLQVKLSHVSCNAWVLFGISRLKKQ